MCVASDKPKLTTGTGRGAATSTNNAGSGVGTPGGYAHARVKGLPSSESG